MIFGFARRRLPLVVLILLGGMSLTVAAQQNFDTVTVTTQTLAGSVSMLLGSGGNIAVSVGPDGVLMIDDQFAPLAPKIKAAIAKLSPGAVRFLINTHWHGDHSGGNEVFGRDGALIVAHDNVRNRMGTDQFLKLFNQKVPAAPGIALPVVTFAESVTFHLNGDDIHVIHVANAHTDGDAIIHFAKANVIHMGDTYFNGGYPFIDTGSGGSLVGVIKATESALAMIDDKTKVIPGHGPVGTKADLKTYHDLLVTIRDRINKIIAEGKTVDQVIAAKPLADLDAKYGKGFMGPDMFLRIIYESLSKK